MRDLSLRKHGFDRRDENGVVGAHDLAQTRLSVARSAGTHHDPQHQCDDEKQADGTEIRRTHCGASDFRSETMPCAWPKCACSCPSSIAFLCSRVPPGELVWPSSSRSSRTITDPSTGW